MSEPVTDPAEYCKMTESWLSEKDRHDHDNQLDPSAVCEQRATDARPVALDEPPDVDEDYALPPDPDGDSETAPAPDDDYVDVEGDGSDATSDATADAHTPAAVVGTATELAAPQADDGGGHTTAEAPPRFNKRIAAGFVGAAVAAAVIAAGAMLAMRSQPRAADSDHLAPSPPRPAAAAAAAPTTTAAAEAIDPPVPYTATAVGCLPGSTAAQSVAGTDPTQAWVCVTGGNIGQYARLDLGRTMVITAVCVAPGWVGADTSGADQWLQHRVLTRVQWSFNDNPPTVVPQDTNSVHGDACQPMPVHGVLASTVLMLVQETGRAPADAAPTTLTPAIDGGPLSQILGTPADPALPSDPAVPPDPSHTDVADNTFASSSIKLFGHPPQ